MPDQRYPNGSPSRNNPRSYRSYEERYSYSTREGASSQRSRSSAYDDGRASRANSYESAQANNPRYSGRSSRGESRSAGADRVMVESRSSYSSANPRARRDAYNAQVGDAQYSGLYTDQYGDQYSDPYADRRAVRGGGQYSDRYADRYASASSADRRNAARSARSARSVEVDEIPEIEASESADTSARRSARTRVSRAEAARAASRAEVDGMKPLGGDAGRYGSANYSSQRGRSRGGNPISKVLVIMVALALFGAGFGIYNIVNPAQFEVSINGMTKTLERGTTIDDVINEGVVSPVAGDFIAVDNSIITEGGGDRFSAVLNEKEVIDGTIKLHKDDVIQVSDGKDIMEEYSVSEVYVDPGQSVAGVGSIHHYVDGVQGVTEVRTGATSGLTVETVITPVSDAMYKSYNADVGADKVIALTFDDGPWPETTDQILDILAQYGAKATFFTIGNQIDDYPEATKRIVDEGHQLCTHTWDHAEGSGQGVNLTYMTAEEQIAEITKGYEAIKAITGQEASRIIRAPGGNYSGDIVWTLAPYVDAEIGWNVDTQDWARPGADAIAQAILSSEPGDVVLMHDGGGNRTQTVEALRIALPKLVERGYKFVTMDELIAYNDPASMEPGTWN